MLSPPHRLRPPAARPDRAGSSPTPAGSSTSAAGKPSRPGRLGRDPRRVRRPTPPASSRAPSSPPAAAKAHHGQDVVRGERQRRHDRLLDPAAARAADRQARRRRTWRRCRCRRVPRRPRLPARPGARRPARDVPLRPDVEFIQAISEGRPASPSFLDGARAQAVMDAAVLSAAEKRWVDVPKIV